MHEPTSGGFSYSFFHLTAMMLQSRPFVCVVFSSTLFSCIWRRGVYRFFFCVLICSLDNKCSIRLSLPVKFTPISNIYADVVQDSCNLGLVSCLPREITGRQTSQTEAM